MIRAIAALAFVALASALAFGQSLPFPGPGLTNASIPVITNIGHNSATSGSTITLSLTAPSGSAIVVCVGDVSGSALNTPSDATNGSYTLITSIGLNNNTGANGAVGLYYFPNSAALSGITLTYTSSGSGAGKAISAAYIINTTATPLDGAVTATAFGSSTAPSVTSGSPAQSNEMFIGCDGWFQSATFTQDSGNSWNSVPVADTGTNAQIGPGSQLNSGTGTKTYAPTLGTSRPWGAIVAGFKHP